MAQETQTGALYQPRGVGWGEMGARFKREGVYLWLIHVSYDRKQQNSVKQLSFNTKINFKKGLTQNKLPQ